MRLFKPLSAILFLVFSCFCVLAAQATELHTVGRIALQAAVAARADAADAQRVAVQRLLQRPEVRRLAADAGLDLQRARAAAATLDGADLAWLASQANQAEAQLAGGATVIVFTSTAILIALILIILLVR